VHMFTDHILQLFLCHPSMKTSLRVPTASPIDQTKTRRCRPVLRWLVFCFLLRARCWSSFSAEWDDRNCLRPAGGLPSFVNGTGSLAHHSRPSQTTRPDKLFHSLPDDKANTHTAP